MDEKDLPSSDESDADFVPKEEDYKSDSGSEESDYEASDGEDTTVKSKKRRKKGKESNKKQKLNKNEEKEETEEPEEEKKIDIDAIWADFKKDVNNPPPKKTNEDSENEVKCDTKVNNSEPTPTLPKASAAAAKTKPVISGFSAKRGGLSNVLSQIGKKDKMSTLQKSKLDWNNFKKNEGIEEEIKIFNKGKDGYLEKQDFLQRTDLRQFEIEKDLRSTTRRKF